MKNLIFSTVVLIALVYLFIDESALAQNQQPRFLKQHNSHFLKEHLKQTEQMLLQALQNNSVGMNSSAVQTIKELEQIFPSESFSLFLEPLCNIIQNEKADIHLRILSALALEGLRRDIGDQAIYEVAKYTSNESLKNICVALAIESIKAEDQISLK